MTICHWNRVMRNASGQICREFQNTRSLFSFFFPRIVLFIRLCRKTLYFQDRLQMTTKYDAENMRFAYWITKARMQAESHNIWYLLFSPDNSGHVNAPQCYVVRTLSVLFGRYLRVSTTAKDLKSKQVRSLAKPLCMKYVLLLSSNFVSQM